MIRGIEDVRHRFTEKGIELTIPKFEQILSEEELIRLVPEFDGWIIGDDPATARVFAAGRGGRLKAAVKWGVGTDNVDFPGAKASGYNVKNTPGMFGEEVSDVAVAYLIGLARDLFVIDRGVRSGKWPKPVGASLTGKKVALAGFGNIGQSTARKLLALGLNVVVYDPYVADNQGLNIEQAVWPQGLEEADFIVLTCALNDATRHMLNADTLQMAKQGVMVVNVSRGPLIDETAIVEALKSGKVGAAALEVFETEPLAKDSALRDFERCVFGSHNGSNTREAVQRTSMRAIDLLFEQLEEASSD